MKEKRFSLEKAKQIGDTLGIDWIKFGVEQFWMGLEVELEHGARDPETNVTYDDPLLTGKVAFRTGQRHRLPEALPGEAVHGGRRDRCC